MPSCHWPMSPLWTRRNAKVPAAPRSLGQGSALLHYGGVQEPMAAADWRAKSIGASPPCEWKAVEGFLPPPPLSAKNLLQQPTYPMAGLPPCIIGRCRVGLVYDCALLPFSFFLFFSFSVLSSFSGLWISLCSDRHVMAVSPPGSEIVGVMVGALALFALISLLPV